MTEYMNFDTDIEDEAQEITGTRRKVAKGNAEIEISSRKEEKGKLLAHEIVTNSTKYDKLSTSNEENEPKEKDEEHVLAAKSTAGHKLAVKTVSLRIEQKKTDKQNAIEHHKAKAEQHEYYNSQFQKRAALLDKKVREHQEKSEKYEESAKDHERRGKEYLQKSRSSRKTAESLQALSAQYLSRAKTEIRTYAVVDAESRESSVLSKGYETEAKDHFIWAADLRRRAEKILHLANLHRKLALEAELNSKKLKRVAEQDEASSRSHLEKATKFESKHLQVQIRAKEFSRKYEDYLIKSRVENNLARQSKIKALYEEALAKAFDQTSLEMKAISKIEEAESLSLKNKAKTAGKAALALETAAVHVIK